MSLKLTEVFGATTEYHTGEFTSKVNKIVLVLMSLKGVFYGCTAAWKVRDM